jgi:hypothetical protein
MRSRPSDHRLDPTDQRARPRITRSGSMLSSLLPGLLSLAVIFGTVAQASAQAQAEKARPDDSQPSSAQANPSGMPSADAMKAMMDAQIDQIPSGEEGVSIIMGELTQKLTLTPEQQTKIQPIIGDTVSSMEKIRDRYKAGELSVMALGMQMQMVGQKGATAVEPLLTPEQSTKYAAMRQEQRREMMKAMQQLQTAPKAAAQDTAQ